MKQLINVNEIADNYDAIFCDVWGVIHNGISAFDNAVETLKSLRQAGKHVTLLTNSPRPNASVRSQLNALHIYDDAYDSIVTSGDATKNLIREAPQHILHIGPERDVALFEGLDIALVEEFEARAVVCTGLFDDTNETPEDYAPLLQRLRARDLPFICANPDIVVHRGNQEIWCAGALARNYGLLGGRTLIAGKPHVPIYELAMKKLIETGFCSQKNRILAIGDGVLTDIKGAEQFGLDALFITGGIHRDDYSEGGIVDPLRLQAFLKHYGVHPVAIMQELK